MPPSQRHPPELLLLLASWVVVIVFMTVFWTQAQSGAERQTRLAEDLAKHGIEQTSHALALQTEAMLHQLDYVSEHLIEHWRHQDDGRFRRAATLAQSILPNGAILNVAVTDAQGQMVFSVLDLSGRGANGKVSVADRDYFQAHFASPLPPARLFVSRPTMGRISNASVIVLSRPIDQEGQRQGVLIISVSANYLSSALQQVYTDPQDAALIVRHDGSYVARSHHIDKVLGQSVPIDREFLVHPERSQGGYHTIAPVDGVDRYYAWHRLRNYPLVVSVGISKAKALAPVALAQQETWRRNLIGSVLLVAMMLFVSHLRWKAARQAKQLRIAHERLHVTLHSAHNGMWSWHASDRKVVWDDDGLSKMLLTPTPSGAAVSQDWSSFIHAQDLPVLTQAWQDYLRQPHDGAFAAEIRMCSNAGQMVWVSVRARVAERDASGQPRLVVGTYTDVTDRRRADESLLVERKRLDVLLERFPGGVLIEDANHRVVFLNRVAMEWLGLSAQSQELIGLPHEQLLALLGPTTAEWLSAAHPQERRESGTTLEVEGPADRVLEIKRIEITDHDESLGRVWLLHDITERKLKERNLTALASTDPLTGLPNRRAFMASLKHTLEGAQRSLTAGCAVMMLDIDFFKRVNDTYGHPIGDAVLQEVASRLRNGLRQGDMAGRLGGEEFALVLEEISPDDALSKANAIRERISALPFLTAAGDIRVTVSIGLAMNTDGWDATEVLSNADQALYQAKQTGRNQVVRWHAQG